jgi:hypothetical protein
MKMQDYHQYPIWCWSCDELQDSQDLSKCISCGVELSGVLRLEVWNSDLGPNLKTKSFEELFEDFCSEINYDPQLVRKYFNQDLALEYGDEGNFQETFQKINNGWEKIVSHSDPEVRIAMTVLGKFLSKAAVLALTKDPSVDVRISLIRRGCLFKEAVTIMNQDTSPEVIDELKSSRWGIPGKYAFIDKGYWINEVIRHPDTPAWALEKVIKEFYDHSLVKEVRELPWHQNLPTSIFIEASLDTAWGPFFIDLFIEGFGYESKKKISGKDFEQRKSYILNQLIKSNSVSEARDLLDRLSVVVDLERYPEFAQHPLLDEIHIERLSRDGNKKVREYIAQRSDCPISVLEILADDPESTVVRRVLENPLTPQEILSNEKYLRLANNRAFVARNTAITSETLNLILRKKEERVYQNLASNEGLSEQLVLEIYERTPLEFRIFWAKNPKLPKNLISELFELNEPLTEKLCDVFYENSNTPKSIKVKILRRCSSRVLTEAILREELPTEELQELLTVDFPQEVRDAAISLLIAKEESIIAKMPYSQLEKRLWILDKYPDILLESSSSEVLMYVASNSKDLTQLVKLSKNKNPEISQEAERNLAFLCSPLWIFTQLEHKEARKYTYGYGLNWL